MSLEKLISYTEEIGPEVCEFSIESEPLYKMVNSFISDYEDEFDEGDGRTLIASEGKVKCMAPIDTCIEEKQDLIECLADAFTELEIEEEIIDAIREQGSEIVESAKQIEWLSVSRDLSALDMECNIELIDDEIMGMVNDTLEKNLSREDAMKDEAFRKRALQYLEDERPYLMIIHEYNNTKGKCIKTIKNG